MSHYDQEYYNWHKVVGEFGGIANLIKFSDFINIDCKVIDFGCGGGFLLSQINCADKIGIEVNHVALEEARRRGIKVVDNVCEIESGWADVVISNHTLEHVPNPIETLRQLNAAIRCDGLIVIVVPCETIFGSYVPNDKNHHLYTWNPMTLGNILNESGFSVLESKVFWHKWPPFRRHIVKWLGWKWFHRLAIVYSILDRRDFQIRAIAKKNN